MVTVIAVMLLVILPTAIVEGMQELSHKRAEARAWKWIRRRYYGA